MNALTLTPDTMVKGDRIWFGDEWVTVVGIDIHPGCHTAIVTQDDTGSQFVDYVSPARLFAAVR